VPALLPTPPPRPTATTAGFTLMELLVTLAILSLLFALVVPNLGALVPSARLQGSGNIIKRELDWVRSEARIQGKRMVMEFDLDRARWRIVYPPEQRLTRDQDLSTLEERPDHWQELEPDVVFAGATDARSGMTSKGIYRLIFDEYGFTADQIVALKLKSDAEQIWAFSINGLSGRITVSESEQGELPTLQLVNEASF
jgi:prepilin-type N-terminal cleavage/methylation domain-containing protein